MINIDIQNLQKLYIAYFGRPGDPSGINYWLSRSHQSISLKEISDELSRQDEYIKYISDSRAEFTYGHPFESDEFKNKKSIQLLIHPAWWLLKSNSIIDMIEKMIDNNLVVNRDYFRDNVIPYKEYLEKD